MAAIRLGTAANVCGFQDLLNALSTTNHAVDREALQDEAGRLRVWSGNLGALQKGHSSLDYRLRDSPLLSSNVLKLLQELEQNLSAATSIISGARLPYEQQPKPEKDGGEDDDDDDDFFSEDEDDTNETGSPKTELEMRFAEVQDIIDNLYKISVRIRQPTIKSRSLKAASYQPKDPETGVDILSQYAIFDLQHTQELVRHLRMAHASHAQDEDHKNIIVNRLAQAVTLRRRQFKYWSRHREKLGASALLAEVQARPTVERPQELHRNDTMEAQPDLQISKVQDEAPSQRTGKTLLSGTEATHHHQSLDDIVDSKSVTSYATTVRDLTGKGIDLPPPPKAANGEKDFECPFCFIICPARYGNGRPWRTHVLQDLQPYVCTYEDCELPDQLFRSRKEWIQHEASHRKAWRCPEHPNAVYKSRNGLRDHLQRTHGDSFPESQLDSIVNVGETSTVDTRPACPICYARADTEGMNFVNHLANHLERIAAFALPMDSADDADGASSQASRGRTDSTGSLDMSDTLSISEVDSEEGEHNVKLDMSTQSSTQDPSSPTSAPNETLPLPGLSEELLRNLPDARQDRLNMLFSNKPHEIGDFDEVGADETQIEVEEHMAQMDAIREDFMTLPGAQSVQLYQHSHSLTGIIHFEDEPSTAAALQQFFSGRYHQFTLRQHERKNSLKFSVPLELKGDQTKSLQTRSDANEPESQSDLTGSSYFSTDGYDDTEEQTPVPIQQIPSIRSLYRSGRLLQREQTYAPNDAYNQIISFCVSSLTLLKVDAIVNSANRTMIMTKSSFTLNNSVHKAAGPELQAETKGLRKMKPGEATLTKGYKLPSAFVIHVARTHYIGNDGIVPYDQLSKGYQSALQTARVYKLKTIAFPLLGAGGCGFPPKVAARVALREVRVFLDKCKEQPFEKIVFTAFNAIEERAFLDFLPVFFPPTHGDIENTVPGDSGSTPGSRAQLGAQLTQAQSQVEIVSHDLLDFVEQLTDFRSGYRAYELLAAIMLTLLSLKDVLLGPKETIPNLNGETMKKIERICDVVNAVCGIVIEITELGKAKANSGQHSYQAIWEDYNSHMKTLQDLDLTILLQLSQDFAQDLENVLVRDGNETPATEKTSLQLERWLRKRIGRGEQSVLNHFDEVLYSRQFQQSSITPNRIGAIKSHQLPSIARLYQIGELGQKPTMAIPSTRINHIVCLAREDITRLEVDVIVNSTNPTFAGIGTLDRTVQLKGGIHLRQACVNFGTCKEGTIKTTGGYLLPAKHIIHVVLQEIYRASTKYLLRKVFQEILHTAVSLEATSIAIPTIGVGMLSYPARDVANIAMEEVKWFLESMEFTSIEKIVFVVYAANHEDIYKSLLPVHFPPVDVNVNKALPPRDSPSSQSMNIPGSSEPSEIPRRTLFSSMYDAVRGVKFGKQPATNTKRSPGTKERHALESFERHARGCSKCIDVEKVYSEKGDTCFVGSSVAQDVLRHFYVGPDQSVYSTDTGGRSMSRVEIPPEFPLSWKLLMTVAKRFQDEHQSRPLVSSNRPWQGIDEEQLSEDNVPPGVTIYNAEVTIPREPEQAIAFVYLWSAISTAWEPFRSHEARIDIYPGNLHVYANDRPGKTQMPDLALELNQHVQIERYGGLEVTITNARIQTQTEFIPNTSIMLTSRSPAERQMLLTRLLHAAENNPTRMERPTSHSLSEVEHRELYDADFPSAPAGWPASNRETPSLSPNEADETSDLRSRISALKPASTSIHSPTPDSPDSTKPQTPSLLGRKILERLRTLAQPNAGLHRQQLADTLDVDVQEVSRTAEHLKALGLAHTVFGSSETWVATDKSEKSSTLARKLSFGQYRDTEQGEAEQWSASVHELSPELGPSQDADMLSSGMEDMDIAGQSVRPSQHQQTPHEFAPSDTAL